jgi:hypothetical protein
LRRTWAASAPASGGTVRLPRSDSRAHAPHVKRRNGLGITLAVLDVAAWGVFGYFLLRTITTSFSITHCALNDCASTGQRAASFVPWVIGSAFVASILLTGAIFAFRMRTDTTGPATWDEVARAGGGAQSAWGAGGGAPTWDATAGTGLDATGSPAEFTLPMPGAQGPMPWAATAGGTTTHASILATRAVGTVPGGMSMEIDMDVAVPNQPPRRLTKQMVVPITAMARLYPGATLPASVNPSNPFDVALDLGT